MPIDPPPCEDNQRFARAIDEVLRGVPQGTTVPRGYIVESISLHLPDRPMRYGSVTREVNRARKPQAGSSRGSRMAAKISRRLLVLERAGAVRRLGPAHVLVVDMDRAPLFNTSSGR